MSPPSGWPALPVAAGGSSGRRVQYAALPYRVRRDGEVQIRLITSRETRRWVIPKGWPMKGLSPPKAAVREAYEEAGLMGVISREPLGMYTYEKRLGTRSVLCDVLVFPLKVKRLLEKWPERFQRYGFWFSIDSAAAAVQEEDLSELIRSFGQIMARRWEAERLEAEQKAKAKPPKEKPASAVPGGEMPVEERQAGASAAVPAKSKAVKAKPAKAKTEKSKSEDVASFVVDAEKSAATDLQSDGEAKLGKSKPDKIKAEKAAPEKGVKAKSGKVARSEKVGRSEKVAKAKARMAVGAPVADGPVMPEVARASQPAIVAKKAAKGKGGKASRQGALIPRPAAPDAPPPVAEADRDAAPAALAKAHGRPIRKVTIAKKAETVAKAGGLPAKQPPSPKRVASPKKVSAVKKGTTVRKAAPAKVLTKALASEAAKVMPKGVPTTARRKARAPGPPEKPRS
ncbi:NUDIX hydrolase [Xanthobacter autotrophicus]|uniref:NUDIX hydrolase n=1 Tax=Xanthobacter autotrophicus TaxID=280 RepID=UPI0024A6D041|nr:NUDIX hydrolase [Xanthobacter autotrophicus]MDI4656471.1 NUDIX hydrolase [Xanthobacter autotrophicus]